MILNKKREYAKNNENINIMKNRKRVSFKERQYSIKKVVSNKIITV